MFGNKEVREARRELDRQHDRDRKLLRAGDSKATKENMRLQGKLHEAERRARRER